MDGTWQRVEVPRLVARVAVRCPPRMPVLLACDKCGERDMDAFLDVDSLSEDDWWECLGARGVVVGTTLFRVRVQGREGAVCAACIRGNSWGAKAVQRELCVDLLTMAVAGVPLARLRVAWAAAPRCAVAPGTCPNSLRAIDGCTGWCDFCERACGFAGRGPCRDRAVPQLRAIALPRGVPAAPSLACLARWRITTGEHASLAGLALQGPQRLAWRGLCVQS